MDPTFPLLLLVVANIYGALALRQAQREDLAGVRPVARGALMFLITALWLAVVTVAV